MQSLFEQALLIDKTSSPLARSEMPSRRAPKAGNGGALQKALSMAFLEAMTQLNAEKALPSAMTDQELRDIAEMIAGVAAGESVVLRLQPNLPEGRREAVKTFAEAVIRVSATLEESRLEAAIGKLADVLLPDDMEEARGVLAADNLELRDRFIREVPQLTSVGVGRQAGSGARNAYATAARWKKTGDILSVQHRGTEYFPAFQFRDGRPHPTIGQVLAALPASMSAWQKALWFVSTNGWLDDRPPIDLLDAPDALLAAAAHESMEVVG